MKSFYCWAIALQLICAIALAETPGEVPEGGTLRDATLYGFAGDILQIANLRGKPLIINVWASWCEPCRAEMSSLDRLAQRYHGKQFNIIGVSTDDDPNAAHGFLKQSGVKFPNYIDHKLTMENMLGANTIPLTVLIDAKGRVLKKVHGTRQWDSPAQLQTIGKTLGVKM